MLSFKKLRRIGVSETRPISLFVISKGHPVMCAPHVEEDDDPECFHRAVGGILQLAQFFGILPINYICTGSIEKMSFRKFSLRTMYAYFILSSIFLMTLTSVVHMFNSIDIENLQFRGGIAFATEAAVFYGSCLLGNIMFLKLCPKWISLQYDWRNMERIMDRGRRKGLKFRQRFILIAILTLGFGLIEHILSIISRSINQPDNIWNGNYTGWVDWMYQRQNSSKFAFFFKYAGDNFQSELFINFITSIATFTWSFTDLFIMLVATGLAERYKCLNSRITGATEREMALMDWHEVRECYAVLSAFVKKVDSAISGIILLSVSTDMYCICLQLMNGLTKTTSDNSNILSLYFFGSFAFLVCRMTSVTLISARINDESKVILPVLYNIPAINFNSEAQRLQQLLATDIVALTGHRFFFVTRNFMLAITGAIFTYGMLLLQFNNKMDPRNKLS